MNLVIDDTVETNGNEKNDIGMVVSFCQPLLEGYVFVSGLILRNVCLRRLLGETVW